jgi:hypothetical protein
MNQIAYYWYVECKRSHGTLWHRFTSRAVARNYAKERRAMGEQCRLHRGASKPVVHSAAYKPNHEYHIPF